MTIIEILFTFGTILAAIATFFAVVEAFVWFRFGYTKIGFYAANTFIVFILSSLLIFGIGICVHVVGYIV